MAFTKTQVDEAINRARGKTTMADDEFTFAATTTPATLVPAGGYTLFDAGSSDFTVDEAAGTVTCNFDGEIRAMVCGSFSSSNVSVINGHWYIDAVSTGLGFKRNIGTANSYGSFCGPSGARSVSDGDVITLKVFTDSASPTLTFHDIELIVERVS